MVGGIDFWTCHKDCEVLVHTNMHEAIRAEVATLEGSPKTLKVFGYRRMKVKVTELWDPLDTIIEYIDEDYGSPHDATKLNKRMKQATSEYLQKIHAAYEPWACELVVSTTIDVVSWMEEHAVAK